MPFHLTEDERQRLAHSMESADSAPTVLSDEVTELAYQLSNIHGRVRVTREASGLHFYIASPICLEDDGDIELTKLHCAINVDKYMAGEGNMVARCMKTGTPFPPPGLVPGLQHRMHHAADVSRRGGRFGQLQHVFEVELQPAALPGAQPGG